MRKDEGAATTSAELRAHNLARLLRAVHDGGGRLTRAELTRQLSLARGTATVLVRDLAGRQLIEELSSPADAPAGLKVPRSRGRPTGVPSAHPQGPVALAVDLRDDSFTLAAFELTGRSVVLDRQERESVSGTGMLAEVAARLKIHRREFGDRVVGVGVAVPSPISAGQMVQPTLPDWQDLDVADALGDGDGFQGPVLAGNDATLAGLAEARRGVLRGVSVALHLHADRHRRGAARRGPAGDRCVRLGRGVGHMPLTGGSEPCRCGSVGCWELDCRRRGLLRAVGQPEEGDRMVRAEQVIAAAATDPRCGQALERAAGALGRGIGALVNAQDPEAVGLSGLAAEVYEAAPDAVPAGYLATLMRFRRVAPPVLLPSTLGDLGALTGASEETSSTPSSPRAGWAAGPHPSGKPRDFAVTTW